MLDAMADGFYLLSLLRARQGPVGATGADFRQKVIEFLSGLERDGRKLRVSADDIEACKYAFCAVTDEIVLMSTFGARDSWQTMPLQLELFGDQLAGERFFETLEILRREGLPRLQVLEVFHMCLLSGFQGKYIGEGHAKLTFLTDRVGQEIAHLKGSRTGFAPHALATDRIVHRIKTDMPPWTVVLAFALLAAMAYIGLGWRLGRATQEQMKGFEHAIRLAPPSAHLTITLP